MEDPTPANSNEATSSRDGILAKVNEERINSQIRAWEESKKAKALNRLNRKVTKINAWENTSKELAESRLKRAQENLEKMRAAYVEKTSNEIAELHRQAEEKKAIAEAQKEKDFLQIDEMASKYRTAGHIPPKSFLCFEA